MKITLSLRRLILPITLAAGLGLATGVAPAQEVGDAHLKAARAAVAAIHATDRFDGFLGATALELKNELMRKDPNLEKLISQTVEEEAISLAPRRTDLEKEAARIYAKYFSEAELQQIADFYNSDAGKKLLSQGPNAVVDTDGAYNIWRQGMAQDLAANVGRALAQKVNAALAQVQGEGSESPEGATQEAADAPASE